MKLIFWNVKDPISITILVDLLEFEQPDFLFLCESGVGVARADADKIAAVGYDLIESPGCDRVLAIRRIDCEIELLLQNSHYCSFQVGNDLESISIVAVHFPSLAYNHMSSLKEYFRRFRFEIDTEIGASDEKSVIIIGDFNVNPFEPPLIDFDGFRATNFGGSETYVSNLGRRELVYINPTWRLYSRSDFPGTKEFKRPSGASFDILRWHYLDQVVVSHKMNESLVGQEVSVIEKTNRVVHWDSKKGKVVHSDHLPLKYEFTRR